MAQGKKYNDDIKERAFALLALNNNARYVAEALKIPYTTVATWKTQFIKDSKKLKETEELSDEVTKSTTNSETMDFVRLRQKKREEFIHKSWELIDDATDLIRRRLERAVNSEDIIDEIVNEICELDYKELTDKQRKALYNKISAIKVDNVKELAVVLGTLYDKQALASKDPTAIVGGTVTIESIVQKLEGDEY